MLKFFLFLASVAASLLLGYLTSRVLKARIPADTSKDAQVQRLVSYGLSGTVTVIATFLLYQATLFGLEVWTESLWFADVGYSNRFWTVLGWRALLGVLYGAAFFLFVSLNLSFCKVPAAAGREANSTVLMKSGRIVAYSLAGLFALLIAKAAFDSREAYLFLQFFNATSFGISEPIFGMDASFYVFTLPFLQMLSGNLTSLLVATALSVLALYAFCFSALFGRAALDLRSVFTSGDFLTATAPREDLLSALRMRAANHGSVLAILFTLLFIFKTVLTMYELMYSPRGVVFGPGWTDDHVQILAYQIHIGVLAGAIISLIWAYTRHSLKATFGFAAAGAAAALVSYIIVVVTIPAVIQRYRVSPNELQLERPYIEHNIRYTRMAYGLTDDVITSIDFPVNQSPLGRDVATKNAATLANIRLWDWRVLQSNATQYQAFRLYYLFGDVDVVRYVIGGKLRQLMYSARELDVNRLAEQSKTWQNLHLTYTHGFGAVANPVSTFLTEGMPDYWIRDIPPVSSYPELAITQPRIYFGSYTTQHVYVHTIQDEFDYPKGDANAAYRYQGKGGIMLDSFLRRFAFAIRFDGLRLLTSREVTGQSKILYRRDIRSRVRTIAPFLRLEADYYQVVDGGNLYFIWDAYTSSDHFPYSGPYGKTNLNYIRNSVKVVINAYDGTVDFYVFDPKDPVIQTWQKAFPGMFKPAGRMPASLRRHIRYPDELLRIQGEIFSTYHMSDAGVFYNKEDVWEPSLESSHGQVEHITPYYVVMTLPGQATEEFVLIQPFSPLSTDRKNPRTNMVAWLGARCDGENYGKLFVIKFPKERLVYGPLQISIRANQDETISKDLTLWNQQGSQVIWGNLMVIPLADFRVIYVQPLFLQASVGKMPELKRVIVSFGEQLAYGMSFEEALSKLISGYVPPAVPSGKESAETQPQPQDVRSLAAEAARRLEAYRKYTGEGKFAEAGKEMEEVQRILKRILK